MCACVGVCLGSQYLRCVDEGYALRVTEQRAVANRRALNVRSSVKRDLQGSVVSVKRDLQGSPQASAQRAFQKYESLKTLVSSSSYDTHATGKRSTCVPEGMHSI